MKKSDLLKQKRMALLQRQQAIYTLVDTEKRELKAEEQTELETSDGEIERLDGEIEAAEKEEARQLRIAQTLGTAGSGSSSEDGEMNKIAKRFSFLKAARAAAQGAALVGVEKEMNDEAVREAVSLNLEFNSSERSFSIPSRMVRATNQSVTNDNAEFGGVLVTQENRMVESFIPRLFLEEAGASMLPGLVGNVALPQFADYEYEWLEELESVSLKAAKVGGPVLKPRRASAGVGISNQLLLQTSVEVENIVYNKLRGASARALNRAALNGDGIKAPLGILNLPGVQTALSTAEEEATFESIIELWKLVASSNADVGNATFIMNSVLAAALKTTKKDAGSGRFVMENGMIDGSKTIVTNLVEELGGLQTLIYGDFSEMYIGQWGGVNFVADNVTGAGSGQVKLYSNMYADVQCANANAFAVNKFLKG